MGFTQLIEIDTSDTQVVADHLAAWDGEQRGVAPGYLGYRLLADRDAPSRCLILVDFTSYDEAQANSDRPETAAWAAKLAELAQSSPRFRDCDTVSP